LSGALVFILKGDEWLSTGRGDTFGDTGFQRVLNIV
jgi:hypothetical protein